MTATNIVLATGDYTIAPGRRATFRLAPSQVKVLLLFGAILHSRLGSRVGSSEDFNEGWAGTNGPGSLQASVTVVNGFGHSYIGKVTLIK
jgi:hypothetical protein